MGLKRTARCLHAALDIMTTDAHASCGEVNQIATTGSTAAWKFRHSEQLLVDIQGGPLLSFPWCNLQHLAMWVGGWVGGRVGGWVYLKPFHFSSITVSHQESSGLSA